MRVIIKLKNSEKDDKCITKNVFKTEDENILAKDYNEKWVNIILEKEKEKLYL